MILKRRLFGLVLMIGVFTLIIGCSANKDKDNNSEPKSKEVNTEENDLQELFAEADEVAMEYYRAKFEHDIPKMYEMLSSEGQEEFMEGNYIITLFKDRATPEQLIDPEEFKKVREDNIDLQYDAKADFPVDFFKEFELLKDKYEIRRIEDEYEENGKLRYFMNPKDRYDGYKKSSSDYDVVFLTQNSKEEWKVNKFTEWTEGPNLETVEETNPGTIIHEYQDGEEKDSFN